MNRIFILCLLFLLVGSFTKAQSFAEESTKLVLINKLEQFELKEHQDFQERFDKKLRDFFKIQSENFVDEETGFFNLWGELFHYFESDIKKNARWKSRIEEYYRTTEYQAFVQKEIDRYAKTLNEQRKEQLGKYFDLKQSAEVKIQLESLKRINLKSNAVESTISNIQEMILSEVVPEVIDMILGPLFIFPILGFILGTAFIKGIRVFLFILLIAFPVIQSIRLSNRIEKQLTERFVSYKDKQFSLEAKLRANTIDYFNALKKQY